MNTILFIVLGILSAGELSIAVEFARRLSNRSYRVRFLIPSKFAYVLQNHNLDYLALEPAAGSGANRKKVLPWLEELQPRMAVISDPFTMENSRHWSGVRLEDLKERAIPTVAVDEYQFRSTRYKVDYYGLRAEILPPLIDQCDYRIRNCPLNTPRTPTEPRTYYYSFLGEQKVLSPEERTETKRQLGLEPDQRMIFYASSNWETVNMHKLLSLTAFIKWRSILLEHYLEQLDGNNVLVHVGPKPMGHYLDKVRCINLENVKPSLFENYVLSADLFITFNIVSVTLSRAVFGQVPSLVFQNPKLIDFRKLQHKLQQLPAWYRQMADELKVAHPFKASTFGWHNFLNPVLTDNPYLETFHTAPFYKMSAAIESLNRLLSDPEEIQSLRCKQDRYARHTLELPSPDRVIREICDHLDSVR